MLDTFEWHWPTSYPPSVPRISRTQPVTGIAASGFDLVIRLRVGMRQAQMDTAGQYTLQSAAMPMADVRPQNRRALALLNTWMSEADDLGDKWWNEFERNQRAHRFSLREME